MLFGLKDQTKNGGNSGSAEALLLILEIEAMMYTTAKIPSEQKIGKTQIDKTTCNDRVPNCGVRPFSDGNRKAVVA